MRFGQKKMQGIEELRKTFAPWEGFGACGHQLDTITEVLAEVLGKTKVHINVPYSNFNCHGDAIKVAKDVKGLMPFSTARVSFDEVTTLYYGDNHVNRGNYLPFQSEVDCYFIKDIDTSGALWVTVDLEKGPSWRTYL